MRRFLTLLASLAALTPAAASTSVWLLSGPDCNICSIYEEVAAYRGYGDRLEVDGREVPIRTADKRSLPPPLAAYFGPDDTDDEYWPIQLTVAVVEDDRVVYAANIAESVDWGEGRIAPRFMDPPATETPDALHEYGFDYAEYFRTHINLEYFLKRASGSVARPHRAGSVRVAPAPGLRTTKRVSIWGTAVQPANNGLFISKRIGQLVERIGRERLFVTYANGADTSRRDTLVLDAGEYRFVPSNLSADFAGDFAGIDDWFSHIASSDSEQHLVIHVGHSGPTGLPVWGHALKVSADALAAAIRATEKETTLVSGGCHSGLFAGAAQCGFFAAHPEVIATGCQRSLDAVDASDDYLKYFFLAPAGARDANRDGAVSFREAHWYAATRVERHNLVYSDIDGVVDTYFGPDDDALPESLTLAELRPLVEGLPRPQRAAFAVLSAGLSEDTVIGLSDHVALNRKALDALEGTVEDSSEVRNAKSGLPYPLNLVGLARQAVFVARGNALDAETLECGAQRIDAFIGEP